MKSLTYYLWRLFKYIPIGGGGAGSPFVGVGSNIATSPGARDTWGGEDVDVTDWDKSDDFIYASAVANGGMADAVSNLQLQWRNKTDEGAFVDLSGAGELTWDGSGLVNGNPVIEAESVCTDAGVWQNGREYAGSSSSKVGLTGNQWTELHYEIECSGAHDGDEYEFRMYDNTEGAQVDICLATITMAVAAEVGMAPHYYHKHLQGN